MVKSGAKSLLHCREEARPSVFDRLTNGSQQRVDGVRTKMRMDSVPASQIDAGSLSYEDDEPLAAPSIFVVRASLQESMSEKASRIHTWTFPSRFIHCLFGK